MIDRYHFIADSLYNFYKENIITEFHILNLNEKLNKKKIINDKKNICKNKIKNENKNYCYIYRYLKYRLNGTCFLFGI